MRVFSILLLAGTLAAQQAPPAKYNVANTEPFIKDYIGASIGPLPDTLKLDPFYTRYTDALGIPVVSSGKPPDMAMLVARDIIVHMLSKRPDVREAMIARKYRVVVMAQTEMTTDLPEQRNWKKPPAPATMSAEAKARYD